MALPGPIPLAVLDSSGNKVKTLYLPACGSGMRLLEWEKDSEIRKIPRVGERERINGYLPILTLKWPIYDERPGRGYVIGTANGQRPTAEQLFQIVSAASGSLKVGQGIGGTGFVVGVIKVSGTKLVLGGFAGDLQLVLRGRDYRSEMTLGAF
jgi:hypothetical protein